MNFADYTSPKRRKNEEGNQLVIDKRQPFDEMPAEIIGMISNFLDKKDAASLSKVNKSVRDAVVRTKRRERASVKTAKDLNEVDNPNPWNVDFDCKPIRVREPKDLDGLEYCKSATIELVNLANEPLLDAINTLGENMKKSLTLNLEDAFYLDVFRPILLNKIRQLADNITVNIRLLDVPGRVDLSVFGNVHTLDASYTNIEEITGLGRVHTLNLAGTGVTNVNNLGNVYTLDLSDTRVESVENLENVVNLDLSESSVMIVKNLPNVVNLNLSKTYDLETLNGVPNVVTLNLYDSNIHGFDECPNLKNLNVARSRIDNIDITKFPHLEKITLSRGKKITGMPTIIVE